MGGRGASSASRYGGGGGISESDILSRSDLISLRGSKQTEVDDVLTVLRDVNGRYGSILEDVQIATLAPRAQNAIAFYGSDDILGFNKTLFDSGKMDKAYDACIDSGFHPSRGNKSGIQAVIAHECGHKLNAQLQSKMSNGGKTLTMDEAATRVVNEARKQTKHRGVVKMSSKISKYATASNAEAIAEAFSDVYCNGSKARPESKAIMSVVDSYLL